MAINSNRVLIVCIFINLITAFAMIMTTSPSNVITGTNEFFHSSDLAKTSPGDAFINASVSQAELLAHCANTTDPSGCVKQTQANPLSIILSPLEQAVNVLSFLGMIIGMLALAVVSWTAYLQLFTILRDPASFFILKMLAFMIIMVLVFCNYMVASSIFNAVFGRRTGVQ